MSTTPVFSPVEGRALALADVPDPVFSGGMVGYGAAVAPPRAPVGRHRASPRRPAAGAVG